ncbi:protein of unknown function [Methanoculleus bourgensis]|uniref:Uncharacterized protein n=1 Tax=Methanoculleus bourgensis TaxID=83986 RepID=A0A0X3BI17_9EURY|nr:protein of unknown function [Methanoculleus bourgensis]
MHPARYDGCGHRVRARALELVPARPDRLLDKRLIVGAEPAFIFDTGYQTIRAALLKSHAAVNWNREREKWYDGATAI